MFGRPLTQSSYRTPVTFPQSAITCSKLTTETVEQDVICSKLTPCSSVYIVNFEKVNADWVRSKEAKRSD